MEFLHSFTSFYIVMLHNTTVSIIWYLRFLQVGYSEYVCYTHK